MKYIYFLVGIVCTIGAYWILPVVVSKTLIGSMLFILGLVYLNAGSTYKKK